MEQLLLILLLGTIKAHQLHEIKLDCPHDPRHENGYSHGSVNLQIIEYSKGKLRASVDNNCPFEVHGITNAVRSVKALHWVEKFTTGQAKTSTNAGDGTFETKLEDDQIIGMCGFHGDILVHHHGRQKAVTCMEFSCNTTHCIPTLHVLVPQHYCQSVKQCSMHVMTQRVLVTMHVTFCPEGIVLGGRCIVPSFQPRGVERHAMSYRVETTCFFEYSLPRTHAAQDYVGLMTKLAIGDNCNNLEEIGSYVCFIKGYGMPIYVPRDTSSTGMLIFGSLLSEHYGEDHDRFGGPRSHTVIAGRKEVTLKTGESDKINVTCFAGYISYTSLYHYPKQIDGKYPTILGLGALPYVNYSDCHPKLLPLVWQGSTEIYGTVENLDPCQVHCSISGAGAQCEAFSKTGIYSLNSTQCLVGNTHKFRKTEHQVTFTCPDITKRMEIYCNGQQIPIKTEELIVGQCIYTITSLFSLFPSVANSLAVEMCVQGIHGWLTITIFTTFCFGWILIPTVTWFILISIRGIIFMVNYTRSGAKIAHLMKKLKEEFQHTIGNTTCDYCFVECQCKQELEAHKNYCQRGNCPYCMKDVEPSSVMLNEHFKNCLLRDKYYRKLQSVVSEVPLTSKTSRRLGSFRYKNRCFILVVWLFLLMTELVIWAASAEEIKEAPQWQNTAHGIGRVTMSADYELDFSLPSSSEFAHKRMLISPDSTKKELPFTVHISDMHVHATIQELGAWMDGELNVKSVFHCFGACNKYSYPWQYASCHLEQDYQYQTSWGCNPTTCPGVNTGCTACGIYIDKLRTVATAYKILSLRYTRNVCFQLGTQKDCRTVSSNDCFVSGGVKICIVGTVSELRGGDTLVFFGPMTSGEVLIRDWCTSNCRFGDPGDIITGHSGLKCPTFAGSFSRICKFSTEPHCQFSGNTVSGAKRVLETIDSYLSINMTKPRLDGSILSWETTGADYKDHINVLVSKEVEFEDLTETPCKVELTTVKISGAWGSGIGFALTCSVSLSDCNSFLTTFKVCDRAMCYGAAVTTLNRGHNTVTIKGVGGHSGSNFKCCHEEKCATGGLKAEAPHLQRVQELPATTSMSYSDGTDSVGFLSWCSKVGEWFENLFSGNWLVILLMLGLLVLSILLLIFLCPTKRYR
nr:MAG: glycoprotein precursor [Huangpi virus]